MNDHLGGFDLLVLCVQGSGDVRKLVELLDGRKDGRDHFLRMISCLLENLLALDEFVWHQFSIVFL